MDGAPALFVGQARLRTTSQSRCRSTAPLVGEPLAKRESLSKCQGLPSIGEVARRSRDGGDEELYVLPHRGVALCEPATF